MDDDNSLRREGETAAGEEPVAPGIATACETPTGDRPDAFSPVVPMIISCAIFMESLDNTALATALPTIARDLGESPITLKLSLTSYLLALAITLVASGWLADRFGPRQLFRFAIGLFMAGSVISGLSLSLPMLIGGRIIQGVGGALMVPIGRVIIMRLAPRSQLMNAMAWMMGIAMIGPICGPVLGGFVTSYLNWRWIFWINAPIAVLGVVLTTLYIPNLSASSVRVAFDLRGFLLLSGGMCMLIGGLTTLGIGGVPPQLCVGLSIVGALMTLGYISYSRRVANPIIDLSLFRYRTFNLALSGGLAYRMAIGAGPFLLPLLLQYGFGMSPFESGGVTFVGAFGGITLRLFSSRVLKRFGFRTALLGNGVATALFLAAPALFGLATPVWVIYAVTLVGGFFRFFGMTALGLLPLAEISAQQATRATPIISAIQQISQALGISAVAMILQLQVGKVDIIPLDAFYLPFMSLGVLALIGTALLLRLPRDAGDEISGHRA